MVCSLSTTYPQTSVGAFVAPGVLSAQEMSSPIGAKGTVFHINLELNF
jgi:hypothetical protein